MAKEEVSKPFRVGRLDTYLLGMDLGLYSDFFGSLFQRYCV